MKQYEIFRNGKIVGGVEYIMISSYDTNTQYKTSATFSTTDSFYKFQHKSFKKVEKN